MNVPEFPFSSDECRLLLLLEATGSVKEVAAGLKRDVSVVSRQIAGLGARSSLVEKLNGRWQVSPEGKRLNAWSRDAILAQGRVMKSQVSLKIATTPEFAARILAPGLAEFGRSLEGHQIHVIAAEGGVEALLLSGEADIGMDCGRPREPSVRFQRVVSEPFAIVMAPALGKSKSRGKIGSIEDLRLLPHLSYSRYSTSRGLKLAVDLFDPVAVFNDLGAVRGAAKAGLGWAVMPRYTVCEELERGELVEVVGRGIPQIDPEQFGVWWLRDRRSLEPWAAHAVRWLRKQSLY